MGVARQNAHQGLRSDRFARAGFADDAKRLAFIEVKRNAANRADHSVIGEERNREVANRKDDFFARRSWSDVFGEVNRLEFLFHLLAHSETPFKDGLKASRRPLPKRLKEIIMTHMMIEPQMIM